MTCNVTFYGEHCRNTAVAVLDVICEHEHIEPEVPTCLRCLDGIEKRKGYCAPCLRKGYPDVPIQIINSVPLSHV